METYISTDWTYAGSVAVDSGRLLLIDPAYERPTTAAVDLSLRAGPFAEVALSEHQLHTAFACCSGIGDGIYPVHVRIVPSPLDGQPVVGEMRVQFIQVEEEPF